MSKQPQPPKHPWMPVAVSDTPLKYRTPGVISKQDIRAIKNCWAGDASPHEQRLALQAILYSVARLGDMTYYPDSMGGERDSAFAQGMRHVGLQVQKVAEVGNIYLQGDNDKPET